MASPDIRVMVIDDHEVVRRGVVDLCASHPRLEVVAEAATVAEATRRGAAVRPDVALVDIHLPDGTGLEVMRHLSVTSPKTRFVVLTCFDHGDYSAASLAAGARAFVLKSARGAQVVDAVLAVADGRILLHGDAVPRPRAESDDRPGRLTPSERMVVGCIGDGLSNRETGDRLNMSEKTVKNHVTAAMAKLGFRRRTQVAAWEAARSRPVATAAVPRLPAPRRAPSAG